MNESNLSPEREAFHKVLLSFRNQLRIDNTIYDIGVSKAHGAYYQEVFRGYLYKTIDRNEAIKPDIVLDLEHISAQFGLPAREPVFDSCDALICNGVTEQCKNPVALMQGIHALCKPGAVALLGICGVGYPPYGRNDRTRYTPEGALQLVEAAGFSVVSELVQYRGVLPSYSYITAKAY